MSIKSKNKIRLFVNAVLEPSSRITLPEEASHYLCNVMRLGAGEVIACFNNAAGEFDCRIEKAHKKQTEVPATEPKIYSGSRHLGFVRSGKKR